MSNDTGEIKPRWAYDRTRRLKLQTGTVLVYSDAHYWPGDPRTPAFKALLKLCAVMKPKIVIANGDLMDGAKISRHARIGWSKNPSVKSELNLVQARQREIEDAAGRAVLVRTVGNHDVRLDNYLAQNAPEVEDVAGTRLAHYLPRWPESWSVHINDDFLAKHRLRGGIHAAWNNVQAAGMHIATSHTHRLVVRSFRGYRSNAHYGVETGTLGNAPQDVDDAGSGPGEYGEDSPAPHTSGFMVLTWLRGRLLPPEPCAVDDGVAYFRGAKV